MKKINNQMGKRLALALAMAVMISGTGSAYASSLSKSETVYVKLNPDGSQKDVIVTDWLRGDEFTQDFIDKTNLSGVNNVKNDISPVRNSDSLVWDSKGKDIYYQGKSNKEVPVSVELHYFLEGKELSPKEIAGKSGKVTIRLDMKNKTAQDLSLERGYGQVSAPFTAVAVLGFPADTFSNIQAENAKIFSDGNSQIVVFIGFPGLSDSLNIKNLAMDEIKDMDIPESLTVTADVKDFEMSPIGIATSPELPDMLRDIKKPEDFSNMKADIDRVLAAKKVFETTDPGKTIQSLYQDPAKTQRAQVLVEDIFAFYDLDKALLDILPEYATDKNISLYDRIHAHLKEAGLRKILDNQVLKFLPDRLTDENVNKSRNLVKDYDDLQEFDMTKLDKIIDIMDDYDSMKGAIDSGTSLMDKMRNHEAQLDTLDKFSNHSREMLNLMSDIQTSGLGYALSDEDIKVMVDALVAKKSGEIGTQYESLITSDGAITLDTSKITLAGFVNKAVAAGKLDEATGQLLIAAIQSGNVGPQGTPLHEALNQIIQGGVNSAVTSQVNDVRYQAETMLNKVKTLQAKIEGDVGYDYLAQLYNVVDFMDEIMPDIRYLRDQEKKNRTALDRAKDMLTNEEDMRYFQKWAKKLKDMKGDMDDNKENLEVLRDLLKQYDDPTVRKFKDSIPTLRTDMDEARPIIESFLDKLDEPLYNNSLHSSPKTIQTLLKMKNDMEASRDITDSLKLAMDDRNVKAARDLIEIMDRRDKAGDLEKSKDKMNDIQEIFDRKEAIQRLSDHYNIFTEKAQNTTSDVKFVLQTEEIKKPVIQKEYTPKKQEKLGFFAWMKKKVTGK